MGAKYRRENREKVLEGKRTHYKKTREADLATSKRYYEENKEAMLAYKRQWYLANREQHAAKTKAYYEKNKDKCFAYSRKRKALKRGAKHEPYTEDDLNVLWYDQGGCCFYCQTPLFSVYHVEHVIPLSRGGADALSNVQLACPTCNLRKGVKNAEEFMEVLEREKQREQVDR